MLIDQAIAVTISILVIPCEFLGLGTMQIYRNASKTRRFNDASQYTRVINPLAAMDVHVRPAKAIATGTCTHSAIVFISHARQKRLTAP